MSLMSETTTSAAKRLMGLDTVRFKTPYMDRNIVDKIKAQGESYCRVANTTGEVVWEITRTAYFSPSWTAFQVDGGRGFKVVVDGVSV